MHPSLIVFWKDCRRLWPQAFALISIRLFFDFTLKAIAHASGYSDSLLVLRFSQGTLDDMGAFLLMFWTVVSLLWADPVGEGSAGWATRPITGLQLFWGKVLGVVALVWLPLLGSGLVWWLWNGFGPGVVAELSLRALREAVTTTALAATGVLMSRRRLGLAVAVVALLVVWALATSTVAEQYWKSGHRAFDEISLRRATVLPCVVGMATALAVWYATAGRLRWRALPVGLLAATLLFAVSSPERPLGWLWHTGGVVVTRPAWGVSPQGTTLSVELGGLGRAQFAWVGVDGKFSEGDTRCSNPSYPGNRLVLIEQALLRGEPPPETATTVRVNVSNTAALPDERSGFKDGRDLREPVNVAVPGFDGVVWGRLIALDVSPEITLATEKGIIANGVYVAVKQVDISPESDRVEFGYVLKAPSLRFDHPDVYVVDRRSGRVYPASTLVRGLAVEADGVLFEAVRYYVPISRLHPDPFASDDDKLHWVRSLSVVTVAHRDLGWFSRRFVVPPQRLTVPLRSQTERQHPLAGQSLPRE